jgi:hypothetical protein
MSDIYSVSDSDTPARRVKGVFDQFATRAAPVTASDDPASWGAIPVARSGLKRVTDPAVLAQLNAPASTKVLGDNDPASWGARPVPARKPVTDPKIFEQLNAPPPPPPGFVLDGPASGSIPPPPNGFILERSWPGTPVTTMQKDGWPGTPVSDASFTGDVKNEAAAGLEKIKDGFLHPDPLLPSRVPGILKGASQIVGAPITAAGSAIERQFPALKTAQQQGQILPLESPADVIGTSLGLVGGKKLPAAVETPSVEALKAAARAGYNHPDVQAISFKPQAVVALYNFIRGDLERGVNSGFRAATQPATFNAIKELINPEQSEAIAAGGPIKIADVDAVRKVLGRVSQDFSQPSDAAAAARAIGHIDDFLTNLRQRDLLSGAAPSANRILSEARANWGAAARATEAENATGNAQIQAAATGSGRNVGNATRQKFKSALMDDAKRLGGYTPEEIAQREKVVFGTPLGNTARVVANMAGGGGGIGTTIAGPVLAGMTGDPVGLMSLAIPAVGYAAKKVENASVLRNATKLGEMLRQRSPLFQDALANRPAAQPVSGGQAHVTALAALRSILAREDSASAQ